MNKMWLQVNLFMIMRYCFVIVFSILFFGGCGDNIDPIVPPLNTMTILEQLDSNFTLLTEKEISRSIDNRVYASYASPTDKYEHGVLGDKIEAEQLVVVVDSNFYVLNLGSEHVFEDIRPRLYDVDGDNELEVITIRTSVLTGAAIVIYKVISGQITEYATVPEIGSFYRWLNIVTINDVDNDDIVELVWIQTPHIGGILKVAKIEGGILQVLDEASLYSNHGLGERNLCLSVLTENSNQKVFYVPSQNRDKIVGFTFTNNQLNIFEEIEQNVDFSERLDSQYDFSNVITEEENCIFVE